MSKWRWAVLLLGALQIPANAAPVCKPMVIVISLDGFPARALADPRLPIPTLRRLASEGAEADAMEPVNPTVTWPNHTTMVTGVSPAIHQVLFNGALQRRADGSLTIDADVLKSNLVRSPTVYDLAHEAGLRTAQVDWVAIRGASTIDVEFAEDPDPRGTVSRDLLADHVVTEQQLATFDDSSPAWQDEIRTKAATDILARYRPNLLLIHLLSFDDTSHAYGPESQAARMAMAFLDDRVKEILDALRKVRCSSSATVLVISDHGFASVDHSVHPNVVLRDAGVVQRSASGAEPWQAWVVPDGGVAMVYIAHPEQRATLVPQLSQRFSETEGIERVYGPGEMHALGLPEEGESDAAPDLLLAARRGYMFSPGTEGEVVGRSQGGSHGYLNADADMDAIFIAWGHGIRRGARLGRIRNRDVAPTIAALLGVKMACEGRVLREMLIGSSRKAGHHD